MQALIGLLHMHLSVGAAGVMFAYRLNGCGENDSQRCADTQMHEDGLLYSEKPEELVEYGHQDGTTADAQKSGEKAG